MFSPFRLFLSFLVSRFPTGAKYPASIACWVFANADSSQICIDALPAASPSHLSPHSPPPFTLHFNAPTAYFIPARHLICRISSSIPPHFS